MRYTPIAPRCGCLLRQRWSLHEATDELGSKSRFWHGLESYRAALPAKRIGPRASCQDGSSAASEAPTPAYLEEINRLITGAVMRRSPLPMA